MARDDQVVAPAQRAGADVTPLRQPSEKAPPAPAEVVAKPRSRRRLVLGLLAGAVVLALGGTYGRDYVMDGRFMVSTDDAYIKGDISEVSAKIQGYVAEVPVVNNQLVKAGDVLVQLDSGDYRIALDQAKAKLATQAETLKRIDAQRASDKASVEKAEAEREAAAATLRNAQLTADRTRNLVGSQAVSQSDLDTATANLDTATANLAGAEAAVAGAKANVAVTEAEYAETQSETRGLELAVEQAQRNLDLTTLRAPFDGIITNFTLAKGDLVSVGENLAGIVPVEQLYIEANFKETQLAGVAPGAKAHVHVDALPGQEFDGVVASVSPATGSQFSLIPVQNATGNFTKVVQRVPVRISLPDDALQAGVLRAGLSVVVDVDSRTVPAAK